MKRIKAVGAISWEFFVKAIKSEKYLRDNGIETDKICSIIAIEIINNNALIFELSRKTISLNPEFEPSFSSLKSAPGQHSIAIPENILEKSSMLTSLRPLEGSTMTARV